MRQWELFGITDLDPSWTPPKADREPDAVVTVLDIGRDDEDLLPEPAAEAAGSTRPRGSYPSKDLAASSTAPTSSGPCSVPRVHSS